MQSEATQPNAFDLRAYLGVLRRRKWSIGIIAALTVASALYFSFRLTPIYSSTAQLLVKPTDPTQLLQGANASYFISMDTERGLVESPAVAAIAARIMGAGEDAAGLLGGVSVSVPTNTQFLAITYSDPSPAQAQRGAQAFAEAYLRYRTSQVQAAYASVTSGYREHIQRLQKQLAVSRRNLAQAKPADQDSIQNTIDSYTNQISLLQAQLAPLLTPTEPPAAIISPADLPTAPSSPNVVRNATLALVGGLVLGLGVAVVRERLDDRIAGREELDAALGAPVLAVVPRVHAWRKRKRAEVTSLKAPRGAAAEAYRTIRTNLQFIAHDPDVKVIAVTSPVQAEGKTTTVANLAVALAQADKRVVAVCCDLRKPRLHQFFGLPNDVGLIDVLAGDAALVDAVQRCGLDPLRVVTGGGTPSNPSELLGSKEMRGFLQQLRGAADFVLLDTPPVLAVSDALTVAGESDGVMLVADAASTTRASVVHAREQLHQVGAELIGGVLNNFDPARAKGYRPSYSYYYGYHSRSGEPSKASPNGKSAQDVNVEAIWK